MCAKLKIIIDFINEQEDTHSRHKTQESEYKANTNVKNITYEVVAEHSQCASSIHVVQLHFLQQYRT